MVNGKELIGNTEYLTLQARCRINRCRYNWVRFRDMMPCHWTVSGRCIETLQLPHVQGSKCPIIFPEDDTTMMS